MTEPTKLADLGSDAGLGNMRQEAALRLQMIDDLTTERDRLLQSVEFYKRRCDTLQEWQSKMRDPERTIVCDVLANGCTLPPEHAGDRYAVPNACGEPGLTDTGKD